MFDRSTSYTAGPNHTEHRSAMVNIQEVSVRAMDGCRRDGLDSRRRPTNAGCLEFVVESSVREVDVEQTARNIIIESHAVEG